MERETRGISQYVNIESSKLSNENISFSFGGNWEKFLTSVDEFTVSHVISSFKKFTRFDKIDNHTFLDIGCGSGINSLMAHTLGAKKIVSIDVDPNCIACTEELRQHFAHDAENWEIVQGPVLDRDFLSSLGFFSYVYSWGVLHHTGDMWSAIDNVVRCVEPGGNLHLALYNEHKNSKKWLKIKRICNKYPKTLFPMMKIFYELYVYGSLLSRFKSPVSYNRKFREKRGMEFRRDVEDWLGGLPYEYCRPDRLIDYVVDSGFVLLRFRMAKSIGCNEFLFRSEN